MDFACPLVPGTLLRRYNRFLADVELSSGVTVTAHCANPGSMMGLNTPGLKVWLEPNDAPRRKLKFTWRLVELDDAMVGIHTGVPNQVVAESLASRMIPELSAYTTVLPEQRYGQRSRVDFLLKRDGLPDAFVEVKNVQLAREDRLAEFPDSVTARGAKHLSDLAQEVARGNRAFMFYCVQRDDCDRLRLAADIDPEYVRAFEHAVAGGVEVLAYRCKLDKSRIILHEPIPFERGDGR